MDTCSDESLDRRPQPSAAEELHIHFMSHCEHHMLPFHGQASFRFMHKCEEHDRQLEQRRAGLLIFKCNLS